MYKKLISAEREVDWAASPKRFHINTHRALFARLCTVMALAVAGSELAQGVSIVYNSITYDVITTSDVSLGTGSFPYPAITYQTLSSGTYPLNGYSYTFVDTTMAAAFVIAYNASSAPDSLKTANNGGILGQVPSSPGGGAVGGPLFFINSSTATILPGTTLTQTHGEYFHGAVGSFAANAGGTGLLASAPSQSEVWALYKAAPEPPSGLTPIPEPTSLLSTLALVSSGLMLRRRTKHVR